MTHKLGIIGYGGMADWHRTNCVKVEGIEPVAAYDIDPKQLEKAETDGLIAYSDVDKLLANQDIDLILVATPNNFHKEYTIKALRAGKNVVCEKPAAMNSQELEEMIAVSKEVGKFFTIHQNRRWDKDFNIVKKAIEQGLVGKPFTIESRVFGQNGAMYGWRAYKVAGGGMMLDWGVHLVDQILFMIHEEVTEVYCHMHTVKTAECDDYFKLLLRFKSGLSVQIEVCTYALLPMPRWYILGDGGSMVIEDFQGNGKIVHAKNTETQWEPIVIQTAAGPTRTMSPRPKETLEEIKPPTADPQWIEFYANVINVIEGKAEPAIRLPEVQRVFKVMEAAFESNEKGIAINVNL